MKPWIVAAGCAVAVFAAGSVARADNASLAEALFRDGREAMRAGDFAAACPKLAESQRLDPAPGTLVNVAICEEHERRLASAWAHFRDASEEFAHDDARASFARERAQSLEGRLPRLRILPRPDAPDASVTVDGTALTAASLGVPLPMDPGTHTIEVRAGAAVRSWTVELAEGEQRDEPLAPTATPIAVPPVGADPDAQTRAHSRARATAGWVTGAVGAAGVVASLVMGAVVLQKKSEVQSHCSNNACDPEGLSAGRTGSAFATGATISFAAGVVALGAGGYLVLSAPAPAAPHHAQGPAFLSFAGSF